MTLSLVLQSIKTFIYTEIGFLSVIIIINICRFARRRLRLYYFFPLFLRGSDEQKEPILSHFNGNTKECAIRFCTRTTKQSGKWRLMMIRPRKSILGNSNFAVRSQFIILYFLPIAYIFTFRFFPFRWCCCYCGSKHANIFTFERKQKKNKNCHMNRLIDTVWSLEPVQYEIVAPFQWSILILHFFVVKWRWLWRSLINRFACLHAFIFGWLRLRPFNSEKRLTGGVYLFVLYWVAWRSRLQSEDGLSWWVICGDGPSCARLRGSNYGVIKNYETCSSGRTIW